MLAKTNVKSGNRNVGSVSHDLWLEPIYMTDDDKWND